MSKKKIYAAVVLTFMSIGMYAQSKRISGTVNDPQGPVMMANVTERDANNRIVSAAQTDINGNFSMEVKNTKNKLVITYVGDKTKTIKIGDAETFDITLEADDHTLTEVVVKGARTSSGGLMIPKREVSVTQQTFNMDAVEGMSFTSADEALQGEIAGLDIVSNSGNLGSGTTMRLRGVTTINGNANPLIVVDDKIFDNPDQTFDFANANDEQYASLLSVNVEDIASITVLKDAAATAIWGANGANGVIQITTKRGSRGKTRINFSYKFTGTWQPKGYKLLNGDDYTMMLKEEFYNPSQKATSTTNIAELNYDTSWSEYENWNNNTDWVKAVQQFGQMHSYNLNLTGGGQRAQFRISAGYDHQTGSIIKQKLDRFSTRLVLDYNVSDRIRFSTNFALTYTGNDQNYSSLLSIAQQLAPNMSIYRQNADGTDTDEYYIMNPTGSSNGLLGPYTGNYSSYEMRDVRSLGNPVAIANLAWKKDQTYRITPDFSVKYELLGTGSDQHRLTFNGRVNFDIYARSTPSFYPAALATNTWTSDSYNVSSNSESNRFQMGGRMELVYTPYFHNKDISATMLARYEMTTSKSNGQSITMNRLPDGITSPTVPADLQSMSSSNSRSNSQYWIYNFHGAYKGRYITTFSLRADGNSKFGPKNRWAYFPGVSLRYNIIDESFMKKLHSWLSMAALRASWGIVGRAPDADYLFYSTYNTSAGYYGNGNSSWAISSIDGLKLDDLRWEKTTSVNLGFNLGFLNDKIEVDFDWYHKDTKDLLQKSVAIPSTTGYSSVAYANVGRMTNDGWEMNINANNFIKKGKFSMSAGLNVAQNYNEIKEMDQRVLDAVNSEWTATTRGAFLNRVQVGNALGSIYGFRYKGVYQYSYEYLQNYQKENSLSATEYESWINEQLAAGHTFPIAIGSNGKVIMTSNGEPQHLVYNYDAGSSTYTFQGGDAIYEDINHDGQINALDIVYLGNSLPKLQGGFNISFRYGNWSLKTRFAYRFGNKVVNAARMALQQMSSTQNQTSAVNYRWRKDGDVTPMPRALYVDGSAAAYNYQGSSRYVESGSFVRFNNLQLAYSFDKKFIKKWGLNNLQLYLSVNNLWLWTKYSGTDPEITTGGWGVATDNSQTPRSKSFTASINIGF
ncbi:MAG: SusC/RagA family TonB-linked outer membrane protein [Prevotella sp.]|nr:SusC/RagA family TonB-linked outer membrane protein [Prevotella sp.]